MEFRKTVMMTVYTRQQKRHTCFSAVLSNHIVQNSVFYMCVSFAVKNNTVARTLKQPRCPSADKWIRKLWYIYTIGYYSAIK